MRYIIGIDPGLSGALALFSLNEDGSLTLNAVMDMPTQSNLKGKGRVVDLFKLREMFSFLEGEVECVYIEAVISRPTEAPTAAFKFGQMAMAPEAMAVAFNMKVRPVWPQMWKKAAGLINKDKSASLALARQEFPHLTDRFKFKVNEGRAEAALIGYYGHKLNR